MAITSVVRQGQKTGTATQTNESGTTGGHGKWKNSVIG